MKKFILGVAVGWYATNAMHMYADGGFARMGYMLKGEVELETALDVAKYILDGVPVDENTIVPQVWELLEAGYGDFRIADHLGVDLLTVRLAKKAHANPQERKEA